VAGLGIGLGVIGAVTAIYTKYFAEADKQRECGEVDAQIRAHEQELRDMMRRGMFQLQRGGMPVVQEPGAVEIEAHGNHGTPAKK
jgi:hypothetical protein